MKNNATNKILFFYNAFSEKRVVSAHVFNDVFGEFEEMFYNGKPYKRAMANFKKYMKIAAHNKGHEIVVNKVSAHENVVHGLRNVWSVEYCS